MFLRCSTFYIAIAAVGLTLVSGHRAAKAQEHEEVEGVEEIVVQATRSGRRVQDEPIRVEVINQEEIEEKLLMTPGNIAMLVNETGGVRVQVTSPGLGAANIRVQGMKGRYTQLLADGLPLYGGQASSLGLLQIPPTDLAQVEVIKGAASALYGPSALGGVINLVSRRPGAEPAGEMVLNTTSKNGQDVTAYGATPLGENWGGSLMTGFHRQSRKDLDGDGWIDITGYDRWTVRPRAFWDGEDGAKALVTAGAMTETRTGGTLPGRTVPDGQPFPQTQKSERFDVGLVSEFPVSDIGTAHFRASGMTQKHNHVFGAAREDDRHETLFAEASFAALTGRTSWLAGVAFQGDRYRTQAFPAFNYDYSVPGVFVQAEHEVTDDLTLAGSARWDSHSEYGGKVSPRVSILYKPQDLTVRASVGRGFYAPTPFVEEIEAAGLSRLQPLSGLRAETAETASLDVGYLFGRLEANVTVFASNMKNVVRLEDIAGAPAGTPQVSLENAPGMTRNRGTEFLLRYRWEQITLTGSYVFVDATEPDPAGPGRRQVTLTPRHIGGMVAMWEEHGKGRLGIEAYYSGSQQLDDNPFRTQSKPYVEVGMLGEIVFGNISLFINAENILDVRQTKYNPLVLPQRLADGRWTVDVWGPTEGFTVNGGLRLKFGGA